MDSKEILTEQNSEMSEGTSVGEQVVTGGGDANANEQPLTDKQPDTYIYKAPSKKTIALVMVLSFVIPVVIMALAFVKVRIYPGGSFTLLTYDMTAQFMPTYASLRYLGNSDSSLLYSFSGALGNNAWANYSTYIVNPGSWLSVFTPLDKLPDYLYFLTLFRIGMCGLAFSAYLFFGKKRDRERRYPMGTLILSCCYALMSFNIMYFICLNWLVIVAMLPIVLIGVERLLEGRKGLLFVVAFTYSIFNSFQLSYMMGIFLIMYIFFRMVEDGKITFRVIIRFFLCCGCSLGLTMPIFLPMMLATQGGRDEMDMQISSLVYFSLDKLLKQFTSCQYDTITTGGLPCVFCGTVTLALIAVYFGKIRKNIKGRVFAACILIIYIASFWIVPINRVWHGFSETLAFPGRYSYTLCCFMLILAYEAIPDVCGAIKAPTGFIRIAKGAVLIIVIGEMYLNAGYLMSSFNLENPYMDKLRYTRYITSVSEMMNAIPKEDDFYRVGRDYALSRNDGMLFGYNGISYFSSFHSRQMLEFLNRLGYSRVNHVVLDYGATPVTDSLMGVKYKITQFEQGGEGYEPINKNNDYWLFKNPNAFPLGFVVTVKDKASEAYRLLAEKAAQGDAFACQEMVIDDIADQECDIYEYIEYELEEVSDDACARSVRISFVAPDDSQIWLYCPNTVEGKVKLDLEDSDEMADFDIGTLTVNGKDVMPVRDEYSTVCTYLGSFEPGEKVEASISSLIDFDDPWIVRLDEKRLAESAARVREKQLSITEHKNGKIVGTVNVDDNDSMLVLTMPEMEGYTIKVDGVEAEYGAFRKAFLAVKLIEGEHMIEISFLPPGIKEGTLASVVSLVLCILMLAFPKKVPE